ncbi:hypothetical protein SNE26_15735 [Mucilaginibacter sp. cycad4]|uniref:hypothetical protein n=1 Tax=Mucilaginibacter sp. cycad4 TaxID=3342096 RepID=UPI002AAAF26F|nr:hypothetical protein [Mucilaginibacter gossypii]WPU97477.1 hypothetical protein SNE26_15735 [Mucilaginibacter gossypii]
MAWTNFNSPAKSVITIREPFIEKYTLTIITDIMAGNLPVKSKTEMRWQVKVENVNDVFADMEIITLDNQLLESNNPMVKDIAGMSQAFAKMYNELRVRIDTGGRVLQILNIDQIRKKWGHIKAEIEVLQEANESIKHIISLNDELFVTPDKMKTAVEGNEFFMMFFHHFFGLQLPATTSTYVKRSLLNTADLKWRYSIKAEAGNSNDVNVHIGGLMDTNTGSGWVKEAYKHFSHLDLANLKPVFEENGTYRVDKNSGMLISAVLVKTEIVHPQLLKAKISYHIIADSALAPDSRQQASQETSRQPVASAAGHTSGFSFLMDDNKDKDLWGIK